MSIDRNQIIRALMENESSWRPAGREVYRSGGRGSVSRKNLRGDGKENDQYDIANVPGQTPGSYGMSVDHSFLGDRPGSHESDPETGERFDPSEFRKSRSPKAIMRASEDRKWNESYNAARDKAMEVTDRWEIENGRRNGEDGEFAARKTRDNDLRAARVAFKDYLDKPLTKETLDSMPEEKRVLLERMLDQRVADATGRRPEWVNLANDRYDLGYSEESPMNVGTGYRNGRRK